MARAPRERQGPWLMGHSRRGKHVLLKQSETICYNHRKGVKPQLRRRHGGRLSRCWEGQGGPEGSRESCPRPDSGAQREQGARESPVDEAAASWDEAAASSCPALQSTHAEDGART